MCVWGYADICPSSMLPSRDPDPLATPKHVCFTTKSLCKALPTPGHGALLSCTCFHKSSGYGLRDGSQHTARGEHSCIPDKPSPASPLQNESNTVNIKIRPQSETDVCRFHDVSLFPLPSVSLYTSSKTDTELPQTLWDHCVSPSLRTTWPGRRIKRFPGS